MPELPEVETIKRALEPELVGRRLFDPRAFDSDKFTAALEVDDVKVISVTRRAKYLIIGLEGDRELIIHLGMTGAVLCGEPVDDKYVRASWQLDDHRTLTFHDVRRFGRLRVVPSGDYKSIPTLASAGPEPLGPDFNGTSLYAALRRSSRHVKTQLLGQRPVAGVGNIYADEALWLAKVYPAARRVSKAKCDALAEAIVDVLSTAVANGGTTLNDYRSIDGAPGENQHHLHAYGRGGQSCDRCGAILRRRELDARTTTWCPSCQRR